MKLIRIVGVLALLVVVLALWMEVVSWQFLPADKVYPGGFKKPSTALQFVATVPDLETILDCKGSSHNRDIVKDIIKIDNVWIACYALLFIAISALLYKRNCPWARYLAIVGLMAGVTAAAFDVKENLAIVKLLNCLPADASQLNALNDASLLKWAMSFVAIALLAIAFQDLNNRWAHWISISFIVTALGGLVALWKHPHPMIGLVPIPLLIGLLLLAITAFFRPRNLTERVV